MKSNLFLLSAFFLSYIGISECIQCYQCDSNEDKSCPASRPFDLYLNALVDCDSFEADTPGIFCMKVTQQSPGWFGWKKVTRRCGRSSIFGVAWGCKWQFEANGVWMEICYCEDKDGCNAAGALTSPAILLSTSLAISLTMLTFRL